MTSAAINIELSIQHTVRDIWVLRSTLFLHGVCMLRKCIYGECAHEQHVRTVTLTHTITAYSVSGNVVRVRILICATRQTQCRKRVYRILRRDCDKNQLAQRAIIGHYHTAHSRRVGVLAED